MLNEGTFAEHERKGEEDFQRRQKERAINERVHKNGKKEAAQIAQKFAISQMQEPQLRSELDKAAGKKRDDMVWSDNERAIMNRAVECFAETTPEHTYATGIRGLIDKILKGGLTPRMATPLLKEMNKEYALSPSPLRPTKRELLRKIACSPESGKLLIELALFINHYSSDAKLKDDRYVKKWLKNARTRQFVLLNDPDDREREELEDAIRKFMKKAKNQFIKKKKGNYFETPQMPSPEQPEQDLVSDREHLVAKLADFIAAACEDPDKYGGYLPEALSFQNFLRVGRTSADEKIVSDFLDGINWEPKV